MGNIQVGNVWRRGVMSEWQMSFHLSSSCIYIPQSIASHTSVIGSKCHLHITFPDKFTCDLDVFEFNNTFQGWTIKQSGSSSS